MGVISSSTKEHTTSNINLSVRKKVINSFINQNDFMFNFF